MQATPTRWDLLLDSQWEGNRGLSILCGGDVLTTKLADQLGRRSSSVWNMYGPTETTIWSVNLQLSEHRNRVPLGRPIDNTQTYVLDGHLEPVPIGAAGEIYIGGKGLARGYLWRPELTAEEFTPHPFSKVPGARLYRTGDLGRYLPDGNIEFLGRIDNQVKLRGYRIELGEIEAVLGQHPMVQSSVVVVREDAPGNKRLVAYVVTQPGESFDAAEVRKYLKQKLPEYMIPSALVLLDELPLTPNGKVDRKALPAPDQDRPELGNVYQAPRTLIEETLASIWSELLKVDQVGIHDNFFDLGGHSLLATQVVSRVRDQFKIELPLRCLFESPTIEQMTAAIVEQREEPSGQQKLEHVLLELESLPAEGAQHLLAEETGSRSAGEPHE
jgi:acyl carrier protein